MKKDDQFVVIVLYCGIVENVFGPYGEEEADEVYGLLCKKHDYDPKDAAHASKCEIICFGLELFTKGD